MPPIRRLASYVILIMVLVAIWRAYGGNVDAIVQGIVGFINAGATIITNVYHALFGHK